MPYYPPAGGGGGVAISAGTNSTATGTVLFNNSNGVTFGMDTNGTVTASVQTNYLTTAMASNQGSNFVAATAAFNGTNASGTIAGNAVSVSVAAQSVQPVVASAANGSFNFSTLKFVDTNGVSFATSTDGVRATVATNYQSTGAYLTTAMASNRGSDFVQATAAFAGTNASGTIASNGVSISVAAPGGGGSINFSAGATSGNLASVTFANSNGVSFGLNAGTITATVATNYQSAGAYLTTARASTDAIGLNSALTANGVSMTANSSGLSLNFPAFLTTAANSTHSHGNPTLALTNLSGSTASASNGFTLSLSAAAPGAGGSLNVSAGTTSNNLTNLVFSNGNNVSFGINGSTVTASVAAPGGGGGYSILSFENIEKEMTANVSNMTLTLLTQRPIFLPFELGGSLTHNFVEIEVSRATNGSNAFTMQAAIYSLANTTQLSRIATLQNVFSNTATASVSGIRRIRLTGFETVGSTLSPGQYVMMLYASATATASMNYSYRGAVTVAPNVGIIGAGTDVVTTATSAMVSDYWRAFSGIYSTTTASPPATVGYTQISGHTRAPSIYFALGRS